MSAWDRLFSTEIMNWKKSLLRITKTTVLLVVAFLAAIALVFALAQTEMGKKNLATLASTSLSKDETRKVQLGRLSGWIPYNFQLQSLSISDEHGFWLEVKEIRIRWSPFALLRGRLSIHELTARSVELVRMPQDREEAHGETFDLPDWPGTLLRVRVGQLAVKRILIGQDVVGEPAVFSLEVKIGETSPHGEKETLVRLDQLDQLDGQGASLVIHGLYRVREGAFTVDARFEEARGGLVARFIGIEGPLAFSFQGQGPARDLEATLRAQAGGIGSIESQVLLKMEEELQILGKGTVRLDPALSLEPIPQIEEELPFSLSIRIPEKGKLLLDRFGLESGGLSLDLEAAFYIEKQEAEGRYKILARDMESLQPIFKADLRGSGKIEGRFSGPLLRPQSAVYIELTDASLNGVRVSSADAHFHLDLLENLGAPLPRFQIAGRGSVEGVVLEHLDDFPGKNITWEISCHGIEKDGIHVSHLFLKSGENSLQLSGTIDPSGPSGELALSFESDAPGSLLKMAELDLPWIGPTAFNVFIQGDARTPSLKTQFQAKSAILGQHLPAFILLPEEAVSYGADLSLDQAGVLTVPRLWLETAGASLEAQGSFHFDRKFLVASWNTLLPDPASFFSISHLSPKGSFRWTGALEGPVSLLKISTEAEAHDLEVGGVLLERAGAALEAIYTPSLQEGDFFLELFQEERWIEARSDFSLDGHLLDLSEFSITGFESALTGRATLDLETPGAQGEIRGSFSDLSLLLALVEQEIHGSAKVDAAFQLGPGDQYLALSLEAGSFASPFGTAQSLQLKSRMTGTVDHIKGSVDLEIRDARTPDGSIAFLAFKAQGDTDQAAFQLDAKGHYGEDFEAKSMGTFTLSKEVQRLALNHFQAHYGPEPIALSLTLPEPTAVTREKGTLRVEETSFTLGTGSFRAAGTYASNHVDFDLDFKDLPLELLKVAGIPGLKGKASGAIVLGGHPEKPEVVYELFAVGLGIEEVYFPDLPAPSLDLKGSFSNQRLKADLDFQGLTPDPLKASAEFPLAFSLAPFLFAVDSQGAMDVNLHGEVPLPHVASLLNLDDQELEGRVEATLSVLGTVANPRVTGGLRMSEGAYENFRTGTILKEATFLLTAENGRLLIQDAGATDGEKGSIALNGWFDLAPDRDFPFHVDIALRDAILIRHDSVTATMRGDIVFAGTSKGALLSGEVTLYPLEVRIPRRLPLEVADLEIIEIHKEETETPVREARKPAQDSFAEIRITIVIPGRAHLSGRGLDSEWQGRLEIQGPASDPVISGELSVVRGHFNFLGKRFNLTRGVVSLLGDVPPSPILNVRAEASTREMTAFLELSGKVDSPELALTSQPPLPNDEILSRLLFGRSVTQITPLQALQLAHALDVLAGRRGFDLIDHTRRMLGLDLLEIRDLGVEMDEAALRAGKYLAENVYIEVEQGLGPESGRASLQWEITPNITIQTEVGINAEAGAGVLWKWDY
jgi:translocation and assembly module TamB